MEKQVYNGVYRKDLTLIDKMQIFTLGKAQKIELEFHTMFIRICVHALSQSLTLIDTHLYQCMYNMCTLGHNRQLDNREKVYLSRLCIIHMRTLWLFTDRDGYHIHYFCMIETNSVLDIYRYFTFPLICYYVLKELIFKAYYQWIRRVFYGIL